MKEEGLSMRERDRGRRGRREHACLTAYAHLNCPPSALAAISDGRVFEVFATRHRLPPTTIFL